LDCLTARNRDWSPASWISMLMGQGIDKGLNTFPDIHNSARTVLVSRLHPLTTHPERWERRFT
jgi:hypothetical protein